MYSEGYDKISEVIHYIASNVQGLTRTQIIKLVYLTDREFYRKNGKSMTDVRYHMYFHGPYCDEYEDALGKLESDNLIRIMEVGMSYKIYFNQEMDYTLDVGEMEVIGDVINLAREKKIIVWCKKHKGLCIWSGRGKICQTSL